MENLSDSLNLFLCPGQDNPADQEFVVEFESLETEKLSTLVKRSAVVKTRQISLVKI